MKEFYKVPSSEHRKIALGSLPGLPFTLRKSLESIKDLYTPLKQPQPGEWLYEH